MIFPIFVSNMIDKNIHVIHTVDLTEDKQIFQWCECVPFGDWFPAAGVHTVSPPALSLAATV